MSAKRKKPKSVKLEHALVLYDGPQLALLRSDTGSLLIGHAIDEPGYDFPLVCCEPLDRYLTLYLKGKVDLRFLFDVTPKNRIFVADIGMGPDGAALEQLRHFDDRYMPEPGIFSTVHTHPMDEFTVGHMVKQRFEIDGIWEARDFSQFHGKLADAYSLQSIARNLDKGTTSVLDEVFLKASISDRQWQGGGSYLSFYGGVKSHLQSVHPLRVTAIEYHSPGYVEVAGNETGIQEVIRAINTVIEKRTELKQLYTAVRRSLRNEGLLTADKSTEFSADIIRDLVNGKTTKLAEELGLPNTDLLLKACDDNVAVYAKLVLSYFRRISGLAAFYVEGRAGNKESSL